MYIEKVFEEIKTPVRRALYEDRPTYPADTSIVEILLELPCP
jgi:hypothetical protein